MRSFITFVLMTAGILFLGGMMAHHFPTMRNTATNVGTYPVSYWAIFLMVMGIAAIWATKGKKGKR